MPLNLSELIKKAKDKGIKANNIGNQPLSYPLLRPWQQESTLFLLDNKPTTNRQQTDNKPTTNRQQSGNKQRTNNKENDKTDNKLATQPTTLSTTNRQQTDNKPTTKSSFSSLVGLQRELIIFTYNECKIARSKITKNLTLEYISKAINSSTGCIKTTLQRLETKRVIKRTEYKNGRGGWSKYSLPDNIFQELLQYETGNKLATNWQQTGNKPAAQPTTQLATNTSSSCSLLRLKTTTTDNDKNNTEQTVPKEWHLDIEPLTKIGFTTTHLKQIASQNKLPPQHVQDSIYAFAFDLEKNDKAKKINGDPISYFMGILRNGRVYTFSGNYVSPQDASMRLYLEGKRKLEKEREDMEKEAINLAFNEWFVQLTEKQKREFLPEIFRNTPNLEKNKLLKNTALDHFKTEVWSSKRNEIFHHEVDKTDKTTGSTGSEEVTEEEKKT